MRITRTFESGVWERKVRKMLSLNEKINDLREAFWMHCDECDDIRTKVASLLEDAARSIQHCNSAEEIADILARLLSEVAKVLR